MHIAGIIAVLAALAVAAPVGSNVDLSVKREMTKAHVDGYATYGPYYLSYGTYHSAEDAQTAAVSLTKRGHSCYTTYTPYPAAMEADMEESRVMQKREYGSYSPYCVYGAAVEAEATNLDKANKARRDMAMAMPNQMMMHAADEADMMKKQDRAVMMKPDEPENASSDFSYKSYSPYSSYSNYPRAADAEAAKE